MINYLRILLIIIPFLTFAQQTKVEVLGNSFLVSVDDYQPNFTDAKFNNFVVRDYFEFTNPSEKISYKLPILNLYFAIPPYSKVNVSDLSFETDIQNKILPSLNPSVVYKDSGISYVKNDYSREIEVDDQKQPIEIADYFFMREFYIVHIRINNYRFNPETSSLEILNNLKFKVTSSNDIQFLTESPLRVATDFDKAVSKLIINPNIAEQFRSTSTYLLPDTTGNWIDYNSTYLKFGVGKDGIYRITKSDLNALGVPTSIIDPRTFKLFESGKELNILVKGQDDGSFDDNDYLELWGKRNYSKISYRVINLDNEEYNEYLNRFTDTTNYFLTWDGDQGKRVEAISISLSSIIDTIDYYTQLLHVENQTSLQFCNIDEIANQTPSWLKNKSWYWNFLITQQTFSFSLNNIYPNKNASIFFKLTSAASNILTNSHQVKLLLNNSLIDSNSVDRFKQLIMSGNISSSNLLSGTNQLILQNVPNGSSPNALITDWYDVEYPRFLNLVNDSLHFKIANDVSPGVKVLKIGNATQNNYRIYKVRPDFHVISNYSLSSSTLFFADTVASGDEYYVISGERNLTSKIYYSGNFVNLRNITQQTDYISITHPKFLSTAQNYVQAISNLYNLSTSIYSVNNIFDEFSYGYPFPDAIKLFANVLYNNLQDPKPQYLTLIGDANYDYKYFIGTVGGRNYVPAYGYPVSDNWYAVWDPAAPPIPQLKVGRIPINESSELDYYLNKIVNNDFKTFDEWNKRYLLFSGGIDPNEYRTLKSVNDSIVAKYISTKPISGKYTHFYKTISPLSDFGPYSPQEIQTAISAGGLFISYIGHSGTATWDNSINSTNQLYNSVNRNPLITDFGCSTNKYAEPGIISFGERFLFSSTGQALAYVGNSSLGFQSTATTAPLYFYEEIFNDSLSELGKAHLFSKIELISRSGNTSVNKIYTLTNIILGDPTIRLKIPKLPNFKITSSDIKPVLQQISEDIDSIEFKVSIKNLGIAKSGFVEVNYLHQFESSDLKNEKILMPIPDYSDTISIWLNVKDKAGIHRLAINLDPNNQTEEIYEDDNSTEFDFNVYSSSLRDLLSSTNENSSLKSLLLLNPANHNSNDFSIELQLSHQESFADSVLIISIADTFSTNLNLPSLPEHKRYYLRYRINSEGTAFSGTKSFHNQDSAKYLLVDSLSFNNQSLTQLQWLNDSLRIVDDTVSISVLSAGFNAGASCVISKNGINLLSNTFFAGMGIVVFDNRTLEVDTSTWFQLFNQPANVEALATMIDSIPNGKIVVMGVADDARNNLSTHLKNAIKSLGSSKIDSLLYRGSWALIGWKGAPTGLVVEMVKPPVPPESVFIDSNFVLISDSGSFITNPIGFANKWKKIEIQEITPFDAHTSYTILGINKIGDVDTIKTFSLINGDADLSDVDANVYPQLILSSNLFASSNKQSPTIEKVSIDFLGIPELGLNYQVVQTSLDSVYQGNNIALNFHVYNVGESDADSVRVVVNLIRSNNSTKKLLDTLINKINSESNKSVSLNYLSNFNDGHGNFKFKIEIDPNLNILEKFKDNNVFEKTFFVIEDTTLTSVDKSKITILADGIEMIDGDYVSPNAEISIELKYPVWFPIRDSSSISFYIDNIQIPVSNTQINFDTINRIINYKMRPNFDNGDHLIRIVGEDKYGNVDLNSVVERLFIVSDELKLLNVYNYPNPFSSTTNFVFNLTQIPDELKIRIFSIAGRQLYEINLNANSLNAGFNKVYFDGKDEDGDLLANGVYLYKVITKKAEEIVTVVNKMVILK